MGISDFLKDNHLLLDGAMGTLLQKQGAVPGEYTETWNVKYPERIIKVHQDYFDAGSNIVITNTFGANTLHFKKEEMEKIIGYGIRNAHTARRESTGTQKKFVAFDIGPTGKMLKPFGDLDFEDAVSIFAEMVKAAINYGPDLIMIETMNDSYETKAALIAAKENCDLPVFVSNAYSENGKLMNGSDPMEMVALLEGLGADAIGVNCSFGPDKLYPVVEEYLKYASVPVFMKPNAGLPRMVDGVTVYDVDPLRFTDTVSSLFDKGLRIAGGCCGTTPDFIKALREEIDKHSVKDITEKTETIISSYSQTIILDNDTLKLSDSCSLFADTEYLSSCQENDAETAADMLLEQEEDSDVICVNVSCCGDNEASFIYDVISELQSLTDTPLIIDAASFDAVCNALRIYNGRAMIYLSNEKSYDFKDAVKLAVKYGAVIALPENERNGSLHKMALESGAAEKNIVFITE